MTKKILVALGVVLIFGVWYFFVSPLFNTVRVYDDTPITLTNERGDMKVEVTITYSVVDTPAHPASGTLRVLEGDGKNYVRYENYSTINGPDLFVYLSKDLEAKEFVSLGEIRGTEGNINYEIPEGVSLHEYRYVLTWCKQFGVLFNYVDLGLPPSHSKVMGIPTSPDTPEGLPEENVSGSKDMDTRVQMSEGVVVDKGVSEVPIDLRKPRMAIMGTGCFWCVEHDFEDVDGVVDVVSGYAGGEGNPTYDTYTKQGYREVVLVTYNPQVLSFGNIVEHTIKYGDPTDPDGSFGDRGKYYAPVIHYGNDSERDEALGVIAQIDAMKVYEKPISVDVLPNTTFYPAEEYHQDYAEKNPLRYSYYRKASGRTAFIEKYWGENAEDFVASKKPSLPIPNLKTNMTGGERPWEAYVKPSEAELMKTLSPLQYEVTQEEGTERSLTSELDANYEPGVYVDILSGEPLFSSRDKYDSGTGWPSFVKPITEDAVTLHEDNGIFTKRTEVRSRYADSHLGHVFDDGPQDRGGMRYCMNGVALRFVSKVEMEKEGSEYGYLLESI